MFRNGLNLSSTLFSLAHFIAISIGTIHLMFYRAFQFIKLNLFIRADFFVRSLALTENNSMAKKHNKFHELLRKLNPRIGGTKLTSLRCGAFLEDGRWKWWDSVICHHPKIPVVCTGSQPKKCSSIAPGSSTSQPLAYPIRNLPRVACNKNVLIRLKVASKKSVAQFTAPKKNQRQYFHEKCRILWL